MEKGGNTKPGWVSNSIVTGANCHLPVPIGTLWKQSSLNSEIALDIHNDLSGFLKKGHSILFLPVLVNWDVNVVPGLHYSNFKRGTKQPSPCNNIWPFSLWTCFEDIFERKGIACHYLITRCWNSTLLTPSNTKFLYKNQRFTGHVLDNCGNFIMGIIICLPENTNLNLFFILK